DDDMGFGLFD
nr:Chain B, 60S acidic ribosomal protein P2 [Homo sapiens]